MPSPTFDIIAVLVFSGRLRIVELWDPVLQRRSRGGREDELGAAWTAMMSSRPCFAMPTPASPPSTWPTTVNDPVISTTYDKKSYNRLV